jgi:methionyl-tRNA formyltransferase
MTEKADAGDVVDQQSVPILPDDTAFEVFNKVTVAAEIVLWRSLPALIAGTAQRSKQDLSAGAYFGRRRPADGRIDWAAGAKAIHDLVRGVAPPYPGAYTVIGGRTVRVLKTRCESGRSARHGAPSLYFEGGACFVDCADGAVLRVLEADLDGTPLPPHALAAALGIRGSLALQPEGEKETL